MSRFAGQGIKSEQNIICGVKGQTDLGFSWVRGKLLDMGIFRGLKRASFRHGLIRDWAPFL